MHADLLVFDMDGVLVDVTESYREAIRETVRHFTGQAITPEAVQDYKNRGGWNNDWALSQRIIRDLGREVDYDTVSGYFQSIFFTDSGGGLILKEKWLPRAGLMERLGERRRLAVFTGRPRSDAEYTLKRFAPHLHWDPVITMEDVVKHKPEPEGLLRIRDSAAGKRLCYIGDTVDDAQCARRAGVPFVGVAAPANPRYAELKELLLREGADAVLEDVNQLEDVLAS